MYYKKNKNPETPINFLPLNPPTDNLVLTGRIYKEKINNLTFEGAFAAMWVKLSSISPWILKDFRSSRRLLPGAQNGFNRKGVISDKGQKKQAFFIMQKWYDELKNQYK